MTNLDQMIAPLELDMQELEPMDAPFWWTAVGVSVGISLSISIGASIAT